VSAKLLRRDWREYDLRSVATHEAAHAIVAQHFGLFAAAFVAGRSAGRCFHKPGSALQSAAVSWAGNFGELMLEAPLRTHKRPLYGLSRRTLRGYVRRADASIFSPPDWDGICAYPNRLESARVAFEILTARRSQLENFSRFLARQFRPLFFEPSFQNAAGAVDRIMDEFYRVGIPAADDAEHLRDFSKQHGIDCRGLALDADLLKKGEGSVRFILAAREFLQHQFKN
jgi:hypothetical protein